MRRHSGLSALLLVLLCLLLWTSPSLGQDNNATATTTGAEDGANNATETEVIAMDMNGTEAAEPLPIDTAAGGDNTTVGTPFPGEGGDGNTTDATPTEDSGNATTTTTATEGGGDENATATTTAGDNNNDTTSTVPSGGTTPTDTGPTIPVPETTEDMVYISILYGLDPSATARAPTPEEVQDLICVTDQFIASRFATLSTSTGTTTTNNNTSTNNSTATSPEAAAAGAGGVEPQSFFVDWAYTEGDPQPIRVSFASYSTDADGNPIPTDLVVQAMNLTTDDFITYIQDYVLTVSIADSIFTSVESVNVDKAEIGGSIPPGQLESVACPYDPTAPPPPPTPSDSSNGGAGGNSTTDPLNNNNNSDNNANGTNTGNVTAPTGTPAPTPAPVPAGYEQRVDINTEFMVSNLNNIRQIPAVNNSGLALAWPAFVEQTVQEISAGRGFVAGAAARSRHLRPQQPPQDERRRRLAADLEAGSAYIYDIIEVDCETYMEENDLNAKVSDDLICHQVKGTYYLLLTSGEDPSLVEQEYGQGTVKAIEDGKLQSALDEADPQTPLVIGPIAEDGSGKDGMATWLLILIILLCILLCLCCIVFLFLFLANRNKDESGGDKKLDPYEEEGFVYDFLLPPGQRPQTEVDDEDVDEELFEDEDRVTDPVNRHGSAVPVATIIEEEEPEESEQGPPADDDDSKGEVDVEDEAGVEVESDGSEEMKPVSNEMEESFHSGADGSGEGQETWDDEKGKKKGDDSDSDLD